MSGSDRECVKCGAKIKAHISAYEPWDEIIKLQWVPASDNDEHVEVSSSDGRHPDSVTNVFCSTDCLKDFIQMDYSVKQRYVGTESDS